MTGLRCPSISVIIPAYNCGDDIDACLQSLIAQTYTNWEAVVVCAPSTDNTLEKALQNSTRDPRIVVYPEPKKTNVAIARNKGIDISSGHLLAFLDGDDFYEPEKLEVTVAAIRGVSWCVHKMGRGYPDGRIVPESTPPKEASWSHPVGAILIRRNLLQTVQARDGFIFNPSMSRADDCDLSLRISDEPHKEIDQNLSYSRWRESALEATTPSWECGLTLLRIVVRARKWHLVPFFTMNAALSIFNSVFHCDIVMIKKRLVG